MDKEQKPEGKAVSKFDYGLDMLTGHFEPKQHSDFVKIPAGLSDRKDLYMHKEALDSFISMQKAAQSEGINLIIRSAARNFNYQKRIWENKWTGNTLLSGSVNASKQFPDHEKRALEILKYSSMPSCSRHHWGTDIDLNAFNNSYFEKGTGLKEYNWLSKNANQFGYHQPYTAKGADRTSGYEEEKWHWSYLPVANHFTQLAKDSMSYEAIQNFKGAETAHPIDVINNYILGIASDCLPWESKIN